MLLCLKKINLSFMSFCLKNKSVPYVTLSKNMSYVTLSKNFPCGSHKKRVLI